MQEAGSGQAFPCLSIGMAGLSMLARLDFIADTLPRSCMSALPAPSRLLFAMAGLRHGQLIAFHPETGVPRCLTLAKE